MTTTSNIVLKFSLGAAVLMVSGIALDAEARNRRFSCPLPDKRSCMSTVEVYNATNQLELTEPVLPAPKKGNARQTQAVAQVQAAPEAVAGTPVDVPPRCCDQANTEVTIKGDTLAVASPVVTSYPTQNQVPSNDLVVRTSRQEPFREPAQVMRIYIAPWEDESGDLNMGGYVFSEIVPRKWSVGTRQTESSSGFRLLTLSQTNGPNRDAAHDAQSGKSNATAQAGRTD